MDDLKIFTHFSTERLSNIYLVSDESGNGFIIDPAYIDKEILEIIEHFKINLQAIFITHRHENHSAGVGTLMKIYALRLFAYQDTIQGFPAEKLRDGDKIRIGDLEIEALHVPGHSIDSLVYHIGAAIFTGDTLSSGTIASTQSHIEKNLLIKSIKEKLLSLPDSTIVYPGHGPISKISIEKMFNVDLLESRGRF